MGFKLDDVILVSALLIIVVLVFYIVIWLLCKIAQFLSDTFSSPPVYTPSFTESPVSINYRSRKILALDAEMVGAGNRGQINMLARVSIVNKYGHCIYDEYVAPILPVTDYRTFVSGIQEEDLIGAPSFNTVRRQVKNIIEDCILVGHDLKFDLNALELSHPSWDIRDTALYEPFREGRIQKPSLKDLARKHLGRIIQFGAHSPIEDARAAMDLYLMFAREWEWSVL